MLVISVSLELFAFLYAHDKEWVPECLQNIKSFINQSRM